MKRDVSSFSAFKDRKLQDSQRRSAIANANAQDVEEVLDVTYAPSSTEDRALFKVKQKFMHSVFDKVLQTDMGKSA